MCGGGLVRVRHRLRPPSSKQHHACAEPSKVQSWAHAMGVVADRGHCTEAGEGIRGERKGARLRVTTTPNHASKCRLTSRAQAAKQGGGTPRCVESRGDMRERGEEDTGRRADGTEWIKSEGRGPHTPEPSQCRHGEGRMQGCPRRSEIFVPSHRQ